jgi:hypothetical protein
MTTTAFSTTGHVIDTPAGIEMFGLLQARGRLHLELRGLGFRASTLKPLQRVGITSRGTKWGALVDLNRHIRALGGPHDRGMLALQKHLAEEGKPHAIHQDPDGF